MRDVINRRVKSRAVVLKYILPEKYKKEAAYYHFGIWNQKPLN